MIGTLVHQLTRNLSDSQLEDSAYAPYFVDHGVGVYPTAASGFPWNAASMASKGDPVADLTEDMAAEQKARATYDNILLLSDDPDVNDVIKFLRPVRWFISSGSARLWRCSRISWIGGISMRSIRH